MRKTEVSKTRVYMKKRAIALHSLKIVSEFDKINNWESM